MEVMHRRQRVVNTLPLHKSHTASLSRVAPTWNPARLYPGRGFALDLSQTRSDHVIATTNPEPGDTSARVYYFDRLVD
jgi:hypothetical protein